MKFESLSSEEKRKYLIAMQTREFCTDEVVPNTILFMERRNPCSTGDALSLLRHCLERTDMDDFTFYWGESDFRNIPPFLWDGPIQSGKVVVVAYDAYEYRKMLARAQYVFACGNIPNYHVSAKGQKVILIHSDDMLVRPLGPGKNDLLNNAKSYGCADFIVLPKRSAEFINFRFRSPASEKPLTILESEYPRFSNDRGQIRAGAVVSILNGNNAAQFRGDCDLLFESMQAIAHNIGVSLNSMVVHLPQSVVQSFAGAEKELSFTTIPSNVSISSVVQSAHIAISDTYTDAFCAYPLSDYCVVVDLESRYRDYLSEKLDSKRIAFAPSLDAAWQCVHRNIQQINALESVHPIQDDDSARLIIDATVFGKGSENCKPYSPEAGNGSLLIVAANGESEIRSAMSQVPADAASTVLFMNGNFANLSKDGSICLSNRCATYRTGYHMGDEAQRNLLEGNLDALIRELEGSEDNFVELEWERLFGRVRFDVVYAPAKLNSFWRLMMAFAPAERVVSYNKFLECL